MKHLRKNKLRWSIIPLAVGLLLVLAHSLLALQYTSFQRVSEKLDGTPSNGNSFTIDMSADGNVVVFSSDASNLTPTRPGEYNYYVLNRQAQTLQVMDFDWVSNLDILLSTDGRYLPYTNTHTINGGYSTWLLDLQTGTEELISVNIYGQESRGFTWKFGISGDARYVGFTGHPAEFVTDATNCNHYLIRDRTTSTITCIPLGPGQLSADDSGGTNQVSMSADGATVYFYSGENGCCRGNDLFHYNIQTQTVTPLNVDLTDQITTYGYNLWKTSADGNVLLLMPYVAMEYEGTIEYRFAIYDQTTNAVTYWDAGEQGISETDIDDEYWYLAFPTAISADGRYIVGNIMQTDGAGTYPRVRYRNFIYDRMTNTSTRILDSTEDSGEWGGFTVVESGDSTLSTVGFLSLEGAFLAFAEPEIVPPAELLVNGNMDDNDDSVSKLPDGWVKVGSLNKDRVRANLESVTYAYSAPNTFQFIGTKVEVGVASKLTQVVNLAGKMLKKGDTLTLSAMVDQRSGIPGTPIARTVVLYNNATKQIYTLKLANPKITGYAPISISKPLTRGGIKSIKVELFYAKGSGKFYIDDVSLTHTPASAALLRLP